MEQERIEKLLSELSERTAEPVSPGLADEIKGRIPDSLTQHKGGLNTFRIIIDLRIGRLAAAAAIIITVLLSMTLLGGRNHSGSSLFQDTGDLVRYIIGVDKGKMASLASIEKTNQVFSQQGREVFFYGDTTGSPEPNSLLVHWKLEDGRYRVVFSNFRTEIVTSSELIRLQADMLKKGK
jgi:hypothetical protein